MISELNNYICSVKFLWLLFSIYLLSISVLPCTDDIECHEKASTTYTSSNEPHQNHHHDTEQCTPFCSCSCCGVVTISHKLVYFDVVEKVGYPLPSKTFSTYSSAYLQGFLSNIWHPPKVELS